MRTDRSAWTWRLAVVLPALFVGALFVYPIGRLLARTVDAGSITEVITDRRMSSAAAFTLFQAVASTVLTVLAALPLTWAIARHTFPGRRLALALTTIPFVLPTVVVGVAFLSLGLEQSVFAILAAHVFYNLAVVVRTVSGVWSRLDTSLAESARMLGATRLQAFREVTLPLLRPAITAAAAIVFLFSFTSFGVVLILGGLRYRTVEVEIYQQAFSFLDLGAASALALFQLLLMGGVMAWYGRAQRRLQIHHGLVAEADNLRPLRNGSQRLAVLGVVAATLLLQLTPLVVLMVKSFANSGSGWRFLVGSGGLAVNPLEAISNSLRFASVSAVLATVIGGLAAIVIAGTKSSFGTWYDTMLMLPLGTSAVTIGLGFLVALGPLRTSWWLVPLAHALVAIPFVIRTMVPTLRSIRPEIREAATMLGASPSQVWREVDLPIVSRAVTVAAGFAVAISLGEFGATSFIVRPATFTLPTMIYRFLSRPGSATYGAALASAVVLMVVTAVIILLVDRLRSDELGSF